MKTGLTAGKIFKDSRNIFYIISFLGIAGFIFYAFISGGRALDWVALENNPKLNFIDFFMHISNVSDRHTLYLHDKGQIPAFPPLAYCMYYFFYKIIYRGAEAPQDMLEAMDMPHAMFVFLYYSLFVSVSLLIVILTAAGFRQPKMNKGIALYAALMMSAPFFAGGIAQGNTSVLVTVLLVLALILKDSRSKYSREAALILIAICAGLKIYPAVFGLLYLLERRFKEAGRLIVYGIVFFFTPFVFFGGMAGLRVWLNNVHTLSGMMEYGRIQFIRGLVYTLIKGVGGNENILAADISSYVFLALMLVLCCISRNKHRSIFFLCAIMAFFANYSYRYSLCYLAIPLVFYVMDYTPELENGFFRTAMIMFGLLFTIPVWWGIVTGFEMSIGSFTYIMTYVELYVYVVAYALLILMIIWETAACIGRRKRMQQAK